jgi:RNA polymerase sigma-70 factor (sigma-E family)
MRSESERLAGFSEYAAAKQRHLLRSAYLLCGDWHEAQDLTQTALANLCHAWNRARRADSIDDYAHRTLINAFLTRRRKLGREREALAAIEPAPVPEHQPELRLTLFTALAELPKRSRAILVLRFWHDLSVEATAAAVGCSTGTVKSQTSRALAKLRDVLGDAFTEIGGDRPGPHDHPSPNDHASATGRVTRGTDHG